MSAAPWLYLPIDVKVRELHGKMFLAARAARRGWNVVIGQKKQVAACLPRMPRGFFMGFGGQENFARSYAQYREQGHRVLILDEEGLVTHNDDIYARTKLCDPALDQCDLFAVWGEKHKEMVLRRKPFLADRLVVSGSPRFDVLRPAFPALHAKESEKIRARFGTFILLNSNFGSSNHFMGGPAYLESLKTKKVVQSATEEDYYRRYFAYRAKVMESILRTLPDLSAAFPDAHIVVRPHPSERADAWTEASRTLNNIHVVHEGSVLPWIAAARVVIHNFCTTAVESYALGVPAIAYRAVIDESLESPLPTLVSHVARTPSALIALVQDLMKNPHPPDIEAKTVRNYAHNLGQGPLASDLLLDAMENAISVRAFPRQSGSPVASLRLRAMGRGLRDSLMQRKTLDKNGAYIQHKFSGLSREEVAETLTRLSGEYGRFEDLRLKTLDENLFLIRS